MKGKNETAEKMKGKKKIQAVFAKNSSRKAEYDALKEENEKLRRLLEESKNSSKKRKRDDEAPQMESAEPKTKQESKGATKKGAQASESKGGKSSAIKAASGSNANFMKMIEEQGLLEGNKGGQDALERDKKEVEELMEKLGPSWKAELQEDGLADFFESLEHLDEDSGLEDEQKEPQAKKPKSAAKGTGKSKGKKH